MHISNLSDYQNEIIKSMICDHQIYFGYYKRFSTIDSTYCITINTLLKINAALTEKVVQRAN